MNNEIVLFMEKYVEDKAIRDKQQTDTLSLLQKLIESSNQPPARKPRMDSDEAISRSSEDSIPAEATSGSSKGKEKQKPSAEATLGSKQT